MLNALQASHSPNAYRPSAARQSQDSAGGVGILPGMPGGALRGRIELMLDGSSHQAALLEAIHEARTSVKADLQLLRGPNGHELARALARRARDGLRVQILAWGPATPAFDELIQAARGLGLLVRRGSAAAAANPVAKAVVIDDRQAYVGSVGAPKTGRARRVLVRLVGEAAWELGRQFNHDWAATGGNPLPLPDMQALGLSASTTAFRIGGVGPARVAARAVVLKALKRARRAIDLMADQVEDPEILATLIDARRHGVAIQVLLGGDAAEFGQTTAIAALAAAGIPVRLHQSGGAGAAMAFRGAIVDGDAMIVASCPFTRAALAGGGEVALEVRGDKFQIGLLRETFALDWESAALAPLPGAVRRVVVLVTPLLTALSRVVKAARFSVPNLKVGVSKAGGRWTVVSVTR
jgi:phosphatidylserine/phosphatidylglycerophosphate/cardiolipin synthase-like enzyme